MAGYPFPFGVYRPQQPTGGAIAPVVRERSYGNGLMNFTKRWNEGVTPTQAPASPQGLPSWHPFNANQGKLREFVSSRAPSAPAPSTAGAGKSAGGK